MIFNEQTLDYEYLSTYDINLLKKALIIPIKSDDIYINCFICDESNSELLGTNLLFKEYTIKKEEILFFLSDFEFRKTIYILSKKVENEIEDNKSIALFMNILLAKAISLRVSDIHIETLEKLVSIRFRIDGTLKVFYLFEKYLSFILSSYIKYLSQLDITQSRLPQDGRFNHIIDDKKFDFRVSTMPTIHGESIVIRILDNQNINKDLNSLGFSNNIYNKIKKISLLKEGLVLVTGPTGSGKTTTLYSLLGELNDEDKKIITVEDPVEYKIQGIQQVEINNELGLSFDSVLKNILRQDPDIILIGEIRDRKSLEIALQASLTGHLVLASIHANNSLETLSRLIDLKADYYLLASTLKSIISQRLVLKICENCKNDGCDICNYSGFLGRESIAEILEIDEKISSMLSDDYDLQKIKEYLREIDFKSLFDDGIEKVNKNKTTMQQVYRVISR